MLLASKLYNNNNQTKDNNFSDKKSDLIAKPMLENSVSTAEKVGFGAFVILGIIFFTVLMCFLTKKRFAQGWTKKLNKLSNFRSTIHEVSY